MHLIVLRRSVYEVDRWLVANLIDAFLRSKAMAYGWLRVSPPYASLPWFGHDIESEWAIFNGDP
jgi:hypothetical protein